MLFPVVAKVLASIEPLWMLQYFETVVFGNHDFKDHNHTIRDEMVQIFFDHIREQFRLKGFRSVHIRVQIFNIRYRIRIQIIKSHIYDIDI